MGGGMQLVECALQVLRQNTSARLLLCAPANFAADLLCRCTLPNCHLSIDADLTPVPFLFANVARGGRVVTWPWVGQRWVDTCRDVANERSKTNASVCETRCAEVSGGEGRKEKRQKGREGVRGKGRGEKGKKEESQ